MAKHETETGGLSSVLPESDPDRIPVTIGDTMHVHGALGGRVDYTVRLTVRLDAPVEPGILQRALERTQRRFPYFSVRLCAGPEACCYAANPKPIALLHTDSRIRLNAPETNHQVWAVCWWEDRVHLDFFHGITDGTGMYRVLALLLYEYDRERYGTEKPAGLWTPEDPIRAEETLDPQDALARCALPAAPGAPMREAFTLETDGGLSPSEPSLWDLELPEDVFLRFSSANDASPGTMVALLMAHAIDALYPTRSKDIVGAYVINARPMLGAPDTHHNCLSMALFPFEDRVRAMPFERQCTVYRGMTFAQSWEERVRSAMAAGARQTRQAAQDAVTREEKERVFDRAFRGGEGVISYLVSYTGKWKYPSLGEHMREFWTHPPNTFSLMVEIGAVNGKIFLSIQQRFREDTVRQAFLRQLERHGIPYRLARVMGSDVAQLIPPEAE